MDIDKRPDELTGGERINTHELSPRESEVVELAIRGLTNEGIAHALDLSIGTVNTYWLRIRMKVGGQGRTDTVARIIKERSERALGDANVDLEQLTSHVAEKEHSLLEARATLALLELAMEQIKSTVWATDQNLTLYMIANGVMPTTHNGVVWEVGKSVWEIFKSDDPENPPIAAHLAALKGKEATLRLQGEFSKMVLRAMPLHDDDQNIIGCIGIMNYVGE